MCMLFYIVAALMHFFFSVRGRHTIWTGDWSSVVCSSDLRSPQDAAAMARLGATIARDPGVAQVSPPISSPNGRGVLLQRSEERRVGKECRARRAQYH